MSERDRGPFVSKDVKHGDVVMIDKAFHIVSEGDTSTDNSIIMNLIIGTIEIDTYAERVYGLIEGSR